MQTSSLALKFDGNPGAAHAPELYTGDIVGTSVSGFGSVGEAELAQFEATGLLVIEDAFSPAEVAAAKEGLRDLIMGRVLDFHEIEFEAKAAERLSQLSEDDRQDAVRKLMWFTGHEPRLNALAAHPSLIALLTRLLGFPPQMFQDMALLNPPQIGREKPWHQDHAYFDYPVGTPIVGAWIALDEATLENGCMRFQLGGHRAGVIPHFQRRDWQICDTEILGKPVVAAPLKPGGLLLFDGLLPHGTPTNHSGQRRRAVQFHYAPQSVSKTAPEDRLAAFGSEGKNVSC